MSAIEWILIGYFAFCAACWIVITIYWHVKDKKVIRELNRKKWWEE